jgi:hypothetical protein
MNNTPAQRWDESVHSRIVPDMGAGRCLGPEENAVSLGEGDQTGTPSVKKNVQDFSKLSHVA